MDEMIKLMDEQIAENLRSLSDLEIGSKERDSLVKETDMLIEKRKDVERDRMEYQDKSERRAIEEDRTQLEREKLEVERDKLDVQREINTMSKGRMVLEIAKIVVPTIVPMIGYGIFQARAFYFEKNDTLRTWTARELHLPKFMK